MRIQERDKRILELCYEQQFLTLRQIKRFFFSNCAPQNARKRVLELQEAGFLKREFNPVLGTKSLVRLDRLGVELIESQQPNRLNQNRIIRVGTLLHDELVTSVRLRLAERWNAKFVPERFIKKSGLPQIPDGLFYFPSGNAIAIEIENSDKGRTRFLTLLERWRDLQDIIFVLFVASRTELVPILKSYLSSGPKDQPLGLVNWSELNETFPLVWTQNGAVDLFSRREF